MTRVEQLARVLREREVEAIFLQSKVAMGYLHGFFESGHERFLTLGVHADGRVAMIAPSLSVAQAERAGITQIRAWADGEDHKQLFAELAEEWNLQGNSVAVENAMPASMLLDMQGVLPTTRFLAGSELIGAVRRRKGPDEISALRASAAIVDRVFPSLLEYVRVGMSEVEIERWLRSQMSEHGGEPTFCIVGIGEGSAEPHHENGARTVEPGDVVLVDFGCCYRQYQSDITRMFAVGEPEAQVKEVYEVVYRAHMAGRAAAAEGVTGAQVDAATRSVIADAGYGEYFVHRTGHGIGMETHEDPNLVSTNHEPLQEGDCFSIEPGIYLTNKYGIRIENIYTIEGGACVSLNAEPAPELIVLPT